GGVHPPSLALLFFLLGLLAPPAALAVARGARALLLPLASTRVRGAAVPLVAPAFTLSCTLRLGCQTRFRPLPSAISGMERPLTTESGFCSRMSGSSGSRADSSRALTPIHESPLSPPLRLARTSCTPA